MELDMENTLIDFYNSAVQKYLIVFCKKHELDNVYAELEQKINDSAKIVEQTDSCLS